MNQLARHAMTYPRSWLLGIGIVTAILAMGILRLELRTDGRALYPAEHPQIQASERDRARFLEPRQLVLLVRAPATSLLASPEGFRFLARLHRELRSLSAIRVGGVVSLAGLQRMSSDSAGLSLGHYLDSIPDDPIEFANLVSEVRAISYTDGLLLSRDGRVAAMYLPLSEGRPLVQLIDEMKRWLEAYPAAPFDLSLTGPEVAEATLGEMVLQDLSVLVPLMIAVVSVLLFFSLKTLGGVIIPLAEALIVLVWVFGAMGWAGVPVTLMTTILPVVLMAIAITDELHLLERFQVHLRVDTREVAVTKALGEVGRPIVITSVTTALGFLSFLGASVVPLRHFGLFMAIGIGVALVLSFSWIPALIVSLPKSWFRVRPRNDGSAASMGERESRAAVFRNSIASRPGVAVAIGTIAVAISLPGLARLRVQDAWLDNFAPDSDLVMAEQTLNDVFWGSYRFDLVLEGERGFFYSPQGAQLIERVVEFASHAPHVGGITSYLDPLGEVARALGENAPLSETSPLRLADISIVAEMGENRLALRQLVTDAGDATRVRLFANQSSYARARLIRDYLETALPGLIADYPASYHYSGELPVALAVVDEIVWNQVRSICWALITVFASLLILFAMGRGALLVMVPVLAALVMVFGGMGYAKIPMGIATSMFAALTVGIGVDFGVHFLHRYRDQRLRGLDSRAAIAAVMDTTGTVLQWNATVLALGFLVLTQSNLSPNFHLGLLLSAAIVLCYANTLLFLPRLLPLLAGIMAALLVPSALPSPAAAKVDCSFDQSEASRRRASRAAELMAAIESDFRRGDRIVRMDIRTGYKNKRNLGRGFSVDSSQKILWGVFHSDATRTDLLYVFSGPGRLAGTTLLMHDFVDTEHKDSMWLYLRSFDIFKKIEPETQGVLVPGTALSYEDSRGFIPSDKFRFANTPAPEASSVAGSVWILACPRNRSISQSLGYDHLLVEVDPEKRIVLQVNYADLAGRPFKTYRLIRQIELDDRNFPGEVELRHFSEGFLTTIRYEFWLPATAPPQDLFAPEIKTGKFIERLKTYVAQAGLGSRIESELELADLQLRKFVDRLSKMKGGQAAARGVELRGRESESQRE